MKRKDTPLKKNTEITREWHLLDGSSESFGRLATKTAGLLMGKHKVSYAPHQDQGDFVVITNADKVVVTGNKAEGKKYYTHSWYPGSIKEKTFQERKDKEPTKLFVDAVRRMLPKNKLAKSYLKRLKVVAGSENIYERHFKTSK